MDFEKNKKTNCNISKILSQIQGVKGQGHGFRVMNLVQKEGSKKGVKGVIMNPLTLDPLNPQRGFCLTLKKERGLE